MGVNVTKKREKSRMEDMKLTRYGYGAHTHISKTLLESPSNDSCQATNVFLTFFKGRQEDLVLTMEPRRHTAT